MSAFTDYVNLNSAGGNGTTNGTSGANAAYASLSSWEANTQTNNAGGGADSYTVKCCKGGAASDDTTTFTLDFATNISTGSIVIEGNSGDSTGRNFGSALFDSTCYKLSTTTNTALIKLLEINVTVRGIQLEMTGTSSFVSVWQLNSAAFSASGMEYCRIRYTCAALISYNASNKSGNPVGGNCFLRNNVSVNGGTNTGAMVDLNPSIAEGNAINVDIYQNTFYQRGGAAQCVKVANFSGAAAQTFNIKNNVCANTSDPFNLMANTGSLAITTDYNWTDNGGDGTTNEQDLKAGATRALTDVFTSPGTTSSADFTLKLAINCGAAVGSITDDIKGTTRDSPPDGGAFEYKAAGGSFTYSPSGGLTLAGGAAFAKTKLAAVSGGLTFGGSATLLKGKIWPVSGGITLLGSATVQKGKIGAVSGGVVFDGSAIIEKSKIGAVSGGATFGGSATYSASISGATSFPYTPSGGMLFAGAAALAKGKIAAVSGGLQFGGAAGTSFTSSVVSTIGGLIPVGYRRRRSR